MRCTQPRRNAIPVTDPELFGDVVRAIVESYPDRATAAKDLKVDPSRLRAYARGAPGRSITRSTYDAIKEAARAVGRLRDFDNCLLTHEQVLVLHQYRSWIDRRLKPFNRRLLHLDGRLKGEDLEGRPQAHYVGHRLLIGYLQRPGPGAMRATAAEVRCGDRIDSALREFQARPWLAPLLQDFEVKCQRSGWTTRHPRYKLALYRAIEPSVRDAENSGGIELGWEELCKRRRPAIRYLKAALERELVLLERAGDLERARKASLGEHGRK